METIREHDPIVEVREAADGTLEVFIHTIDDDELEALLESDRRAPQRAH